MIALRSRRHIAPFTAHRPASIAEATALHTPASAYYAGGTDLIDWLKHGHPIDHLIRLDGIPDLAAITQEGEGVRIGATATHAAIAASPALRETHPHFAALWATIANPRVRHTATLGGNLMANNPDYDGAPALLALGATTEKTATLLTSILIPSPCRLYADRTLRPALTLWLGIVTRAGQVTTLRLAGGMAHPEAVCVTLPVDLPIAALGPQAATLAAQLAALWPPPITDRSASAAYRARMVPVLARRLLLRAGSDA